MTISGDRKIASVISEATYGVDVISPGPASIFQAFREIMVMPMVTAIESPRATATASGEKHCVMTSHNDVSWEMPFAGKTGAAGTEPAYDAFMLAAGFAKTVVAATSVTYAPRTVNNMADTPSATIYLYKYRLNDANAYLLKAFGYRGNVTMTMSMGEEAVIAGTGLSLYSEYPTSTVAKPTAPTSYLGGSCMVVTSLVVTVGGVPYPVESFEIQSNWALTEIRTGAATGGTLSAVLLTRPSSGGRMTGSFTLVDGATAFQDMIAKWTSGAQATLSAVITNGTDTVTITAPNMQLGQPSEAAEGVLKFDVPVYFNRGTSGDDELSIAYT